MINKREIAFRALDGLGLNAVARRCRSWRGLLVLNYHRIGHAEGSLFDWDLWSATAEQFEVQVAHLKTHFDVISGDDLDRARQDRRGRFVMITFDDGYRDNYEFAFPILRSLGATATFFITTGFLDQSQLAWWDEVAWMVRTSDRSGISGNEWMHEDVPFDEPGRNEAVQRLLRTYKQLAGSQTEAYLQFLADATGSGRAPAALADEIWMTWDMVRDMRRDGMSIGGHTLTHPVLAKLDAQAQEHEIARCKQRIETELGEPITAFSYPVGSPDAFNDDTRAALREHGFRWAFSYFGGYSAGRPADPLDVLRSAVEHRDHRAKFATVAALPQFFA